MLIVEYNGYMISDYMIINSIDRGIGAPRTNNLKKLGTARGEQYIGYTSVSPRIVMKFTLISNLVEKRRELAGIMEVSEPARLVFSDEPDKYYMAVPDKEITFDDNRRYGTGTITWVVPDGLAHSKTTKQFTATKNASGILELSINNEGTADVPIDYTVVHNHDNGFLGFVSDRGVLQMGKIQEVDLTPYAQSEVLIDTNTFDDWERDTSVHPENYGKMTDGTLIVENVSGQNLLQLGDGGTNSNLHGGMVSIDIPPDSEGIAGATNWYCYFNAWFETGRVAQVSSMSVNFLDENDNLIFCYIIEKNALTSNTAHVMMRVGGNSIKTFFDENFAPHNAYYGHNMFDWSRGHCDIIKEGDKLSGYWYGTRYSISVPELKDKVCKKIQLYIGQYGTYEMTTGSGFRSISFQKTNVEKWADNPNRYSNGSTVEIDGKEGKIYTNGILRMDDEIKGSQYFLAPPGQSKIQIYHSSFSVPEPDVTAEIREAWI